MYSVLPMGKSFNLSLNFLQTCLLNKAAEGGNKMQIISSSHFCAGHHYLLIFFSNDNDTLCTCWYDFIALKSSLWFTVIIDYLHFSNFSQLLGLSTQNFFNARWNWLTPETVSSVFHRKLQQKWRLILVDCLRRKHSAFISSRFVTPTSTEIF